MIDSFLGKLRFPALTQLPSAESLGGAEASPDRRSVLFVHLNYYHYYYLARALRARGWDALALSLEPPNSLSMPFTHGIDHNIWIDDPNIRTEMFNELVCEIGHRFRWVQFSGDGMMAFLPHLQDSDERRARIPFEMLALKSNGLKLGYTLVGCTDGNSQTGWNRWTNGNCSKCSLQDKPDICSDFRNLAWAHKRDMFCDMIATEMMPRVDYNDGPKVYSEPLTMALDPEHWALDLKIPQHCRLVKNKGEILVLHAVGNYDVDASVGPRNYKGTPAIMKAVETLRAEGLPIRLHFLTNVASLDMRFFQAQADIIVDQLNTGRYGAFGRESLMLGKPVVGWLKREGKEGQSTRSVHECPIVSATEETITDVLRMLATNKALREETGRRSRAFAMKWHSAAALAERFEQMYDHVFAGGNPADFVWEPAAETETVPEVVEAA